MIDIAFQLPAGDSTLFYPCAGKDLQCPITCFSDKIRDFYFADIRRSGFPRLSDRYSVIRRDQPYAGDPKKVKDTFYDKATGKEFYVHRWEDRGEAAIHEISSIGIFFFRGDNPVDGEGSSGVLWLGEPLFDEVLRRMAKGGLIVTDGSNTTSDGPKEFAEFWHKTDVGPSAVNRVKGFEYAGREFACIGYVGEKYGPTLVWQLKPTEGS